MQSNLVASFAFIVTRGTTFWLGSWSLTRNLQGTHGHVSDDLRCFRFFLVEAWLTQLLWVQLGWSYAEIRKNGERGGSSVKSRGSKSQITCQLSGPESNNRNEPGDTYESPGSWLAKPLDSTYGVTIVQQHPSTIWDHRDRVARWTAIAFYPVWWRIWLNCTHMLSRWIGDFTYHLTCIIE